ncbi:MAG: YjjG family noncanonical pyrimidine nucleotidase [Chitinophagales bacterium]
MHEEGIRHIFFDLDNTLWDFNTNSKTIIQRMYNAFNLSQEGVAHFELYFNAYKTQNEYLWNAYREGNKTKEEVRFERFYTSLYQFGIDNKTLAFAMADYYINNTRQLKVLLPGAVETLQYLRSKYLLHVITNGFEEVQLFKIKNCGLAKFFDTITTAENAHALKPDKKIFDTALQSANAKAHESVYIGDSPEADGKGALNAGMHFIWFNHEQTLNTHGFTRQVGRLRELSSFL